VSSSKTPLSLAVAGASLLLVDPALAADIPVNNAGAGCQTNLRDAIATVDSDSGDKVVIDHLTCPEIVVTGSSIVVQDKPFILSAPLDPMGVPQVTIKADTGTTFGLFTLEDTINSTDPNLAIPVIFSGIRFADATSQGPGGAINAQNHAVILHNSIVTNNTAVGSGGGVSVNGELLIVGSEISNNTVTEVIEIPQGGLGAATAVGGGAAVHGQVFVGPSGSGELSAGNSLERVSQAFSDAADALDTEGEELVPSVISGNKAEVVMDVGSVYVYLNAMAVGGGIASFPDGASKTFSVLGSDGGSCDFGGPFGGAEAAVCNIIYASRVTGNTAELTLTGAGTTELKYVYAGGGGVALITEADVGGSLLATKYSSVDENMVVMSLPESTPEASVAGGGGQWVASFPGARDNIPLWDSLQFSEFPEGEGKYSVWNAASSISRNSVTVTGVGNESVGAIIGGGGVSNSGIADGDAKYGSAAGTIFSTISGNTVDVNVDEDGDGIVFARGGGLDTIKYSVDEDGLEVFPGIATTFFSSVSGNTLDVDDVTNGDIGGGGISASLHIGVLTKPQFSITDPDAFQEVKYTQFLAPIELWTDPGGIVDNTVSITTAPNPALAASGGGLLAGSKYSFSALLGTSVSGNLLSVTVPESGNGIVSAVGGGIGSQPGLRELFGVVNFSTAKYLTVDDNEVLVTAPEEVTVDARGGGIGAKASGLDGSRPFPDEFGNLQTLVSTISGNSVLVTGGSAQSRVSGGGIAVDTASSDESIWKYSLEDVAALTTSTIANNSIGLTGSGTAEGAGVFAEIKYDADIPFVMNFMTVVGNTSSADGVPKGGQVWLQAADHGELSIILEDDHDTSDYFSILNSLISGDVAQGTQDVYYQDDLTYGTGTAVYHGASMPHPDFLAPAVADPAYLGDLQYNGGLNDEALSKYSGYNKTIALLAGSGAINPQKEGACATDDPYETIAQAVDQRLFPRDACADTGAYERGAENDGDGLVDGAELVVPGTDPSLAPSRQGISGEGFDPVLIPTGDGNSDGIYDLNQGQVASFEYGGQVVTLATYEEIPGPGGATFIGTGSRFAGEGDEPAVAGVGGAGVITTANGGNFATLYGFTFTADTGDGDVENFELILPRAGNENTVLVKAACNEELPDSLGDWEVVGGSESFGADRIRLTFSIEEGERFDCNGAGNGILDPVYVARAAPPTPVPTLPWFLVWMTAGLSGLLGLAGLRRRS
jgi:hypothetical protein